MVDDLILLVSHDDCDLIHARHRQSFQLMIKDSLITGCDQTFGTFTADRPNPRALPCG
jgi:hypothetical protein